MSTVKASLWTKLRLQKAKWFFLELLTRLSPPPAQSSHWKHSDHLTHSGTNSCWKNRCRCPATEFSCGLNSLRYCGHIDGCILLQMNCWWSCANIEMNYWGNFSLSLRYSIELITTEVSQSRLQWWFRRVCRRDRHVPIHSCGIFCSTKYQCNWIWTRGYQWKSNSLSRVTTLYQHILVYVLPEGNNSNLELNLFISHRLLPPPSSGIVLFISFLRKISLPM